MKKLLLALASVAMLALGFTACTQPAATTTDDTKKDQTVTEKVFAENADGLTNCSALAKYSDLKAVLDEHADAKLYITVKNTADGSRTGWGCGQIFVASDPDDAYNTAGDKLIEDYKPSNLGETGATEDIELTLSDVVTAVPEGGCLAFNLWNGIVAVKCYAKW